MTDRFIGDTDTIIGILARLAALEAASGISADADRGDIVTTLGGTVWSFKSTVVSAFSRTYLNDPDAASVRTTLGLGAMSLRDNINDNDWSGLDLSIANGGTGASTASGARANLGVAIGSDVQAYSAMLSAYAGASWSAGVQIPTLTAANTVALKTVGIASGNIPDAEGVRDLIGATLVAGPGLYSIVNDSGDTVTFYRDDRSCVSLEPYYLPQITSSGAAYHSIVSTERLVPTYSGALAQIGGTG
jgi:hypothetical protein